MGNSPKKTGKRQWAKVWHTLLTDPCYQGLSLEQQARYINLLIFMSAHGKKGALRIDSPARQLIFTLQCFNFDHLKEVIKELPNLKIKESKSNGDFIVTFENWYKYQIDDSTERVRKFREKVTVQEKEQEEEEEQDKDKEYKYSPTSDEVVLSQLLLDKILERKPDFKKPSIQGWYVHIDRMIRLDNRKVKVISDVIKWCQLDDFWQNNILSTLKLREQFDKLEMKMNGGGNGQGSSLQGSVGQIVGGKDYEAKF